MASENRPIEQLGESVIQAIASIGEMTLFILSTTYWLTFRRLCRHTLVPNLYQIGVRSVPVVAITGTFIGMVLAVQAYKQFAELHLESRLGSVINASLVTELGPVLAATMLAGRIGSAMAAEIGTMKVTEQIDALMTLGVNPIHYLVAPRLLASVLLIPLLTIIADFMGVIGGAIVSIQIFRIDAFFYWDHSEQFVGMWDIVTGLIKSIFFGAAIALISCYRGFQSTGGAEGVGRSATEAFVLSFIAILASDFLLNVLFNALFALLFPDANIALN